MLRISTPLSAILLALSPLVCANEAAPIQEVERSAFMLTNSSFEYNEGLPITFENPYTVSLFNAQNGENSDRLWSQTKSIFGYGLGVVGFIYLLPEDVSNWDKEGEVFRKWGSNVTEGPVWDRDALGLIISATRILVGSITKLLESPVTASGIRFYMRLLCRLFTGSMALKRLLRCLRFKI